MKETKDCGGEDEEDPMTQEEKWMVRYQEVLEYKSNNSVYEVLDKEN